MAEQFVYTRLDERDRYEYLLRPVRINDQIAPDLKNSLVKMDKPTRIFMIFDTNELALIAADYGVDLVDGNMAIFVNASGVPERMFIWCKINNVAQWKEMVITGGSGTGTNLPVTAVLDGLMTSADFLKLQGIEAGANKYVHPLKHAATEITDDTTHRFVKDSDILNWNTMAGKIHDHVNKAVIDGITVNDIARWNGKQDVIGFAPENPANKGVAGGYASLDSTGKVPMSQLPAIQGSISEVTWDIIKSKPVAPVASIDEAVTLRHTHGNKVILDMTQEAFTTALKSKIDSMTKTEVSGINGNIKIDGVERTVYSHPIIHSANMIAEETNRRFVSDTEKTYWNGKQDKLGFAPESSLNKGVANGYASLDSTGKVPVVQLPSNFKELKVVNNITDRNALVQFEGLRVHVINASADLTVTNGWAEYISDGTNWIKVAEQESIDVVLDWVNIVGKPTATVAAIDDAAAKKHAHSNKTVLDATEVAFTNVLKAKIDTVTSGATKTGASFVNGNVIINDVETTVYAHPVSHAATMIVEDATRRFVTDADKATWNNKAEKTAVNYSSNGLMTYSDKVKLDGIEAGANKYIHPDTHSIDIITETASKKVMTVEERTKLAGIEAGANKYVHPVSHSLDMITETATLKIMTATERAKLANIEEGANNYVHPATHSALMITDDSNHRFVTDAEKTYWNQKASTLTATTLADGLMSAADKLKVDTISMGANKVQKSVQNGYVRVDGTDVLVYQHPDTHSADMLTDGTANRLYSTTEKTKLAGVSVGANKTGSSMANGNITIDGIETTVYTHPASHAATMISQDSTHRFVTDADKINWNGKQNALGYIPESATNKGIANGYAALDSDGKVLASQLPTSFATMKVVGTIAERDTIDKSEGLRVHVMDATADVTVSSGWAEYICDGVSWIKTAESESLDVILQWASIQGKPVSAVGDIDDAVARRHSHSNKNILDAIDQAFTTTLKSKLDGITAAATRVETSLTNGNIKIDGVEKTVYVHPVYHTPNVIVQDENNRFVSDTEKAIWNGKVAKAELLVTKVIEYNGPQSSKIVSGDYDIDPTTYSENYNLGAYPIVEFLWLNVNGVTYSHSRYVSYDSTTKILTVKGLKLLDTDAISITFNQKQY